MRRKQNQKEKAGGERGVLLGKTGPQLEVSIPLGKGGEAEGRIEYHRGMVVIVEDLENAEEMIEILEEVEMIVILEEGEMTEIEILAMHGETAVRRMEEMKEVEEGPGEEAELEVTAGERGLERKRDGAGKMTEDQQERTEYQQDGALVKIVSIDPLQKDSKAAVT